MYLVAIAWIYVVVMMAVAEATSTQGTVLGAIVTFLLYGVAPVTLVVYLMGSPSRRKAIKRREAAELAAYRAAAASASIAAQPGGDASVQAASVKAESVQPNSLQPNLLQPNLLQPNTGSEAPADPIPPVRKEP
jgi:hypothetical protein